MYPDLAGEMFFNFFVVDFLSTDERCLSTHKPPAINTFNFLCMPLHSDCQKQWCNLLFIALPMTSSFAVLCSNLTRVFFLSSQVQRFLCTWGPPPRTDRGMHVPDWCHGNTQTITLLWLAGHCLPTNPSTHRPTHTVCWYRYPTHSEQSVVQLLTGLQWLLPCVGCITTMVVNLIVDRAFGLQLPLGTTGHLEVFVRTSHVHGHP